MLQYYVTIFTVLLFFFRERRVLCIGILALVNCLVAPYLIPLCMNMGGSFYEGALLIELTTLLLLSLTYSIHKSKGTIYLFLVAVSINAIGAYDLNPLIQTFMYENYEIINTLLFEGVFCLLIANTSWAINLSAKSKRNK